MMVALLHMLAGTEQRRFRWRLTCAAGYVGARNPQASRTEPTIPVEANLRQQVKRSGRSQKSPIQEGSSLLSLETAA